MSSALYETALKTFLAPIQPWLDNPRVSEIMINGPHEIFVEIDNEISLVDARFSTREALIAAVRSVAQFVGRPLDAEHLVLEGRLPSGARVEAVLPPAAPDGPMVSIRRSSEASHDLPALVAHGTLSADAAACLDALLVARQNIFVVGGAGSGKTTLLSALAARIPAVERMVVIEETREVRVHSRHVVRLEAQTGDAQGRGAIGTHELLQAAVRLHPGRILLGEVRGREALALMQAMTSGFGGVMATAHGNYPQDALRRLETMCLMSGLELPLPSLRAQIASAVDVIVQMGRRRDGERVVTAIAELSGLDASAGYVLRPLFELRAGMGREAARLIPTGLLPACLDTLRAAGASLPQAMHTAAEGRTP